MINELGYSGAITAMPANNDKHNCNPTCPYIAVIILNFNNYLDTDKCITSVLSSNWDNHRLKIIVVDNGSIDNSCARLEKKYSDAIFIRTHENLGFSRGNNVGIKYALEKLGADYILLLNDDVFIRDNYIGTVVSFMEKKANVGVAGGKVFFADRPNVIWAAGGKINWLRGQFIGHGYNETDSEYKHFESKPVDYIPGAAVMIKRQTMIDLDMLPECYFLGGEEVDFCVQSRKRGYEIFYIADKKAYAWHNVGYSSKKSPVHSYNRFRNSFLFWERNVPEPIRTVLKLYNWFLWVIVGGIMQMGKKEIKLRRKMFLIAMKDHKRFQEVKKEHWDKVDSEIGLSI